MDYDSTDNVVAEFTVSSTGRKYRLSVTSALTIPNIKIAMESGSMDKMNMVINTGYERILHTPEEIFELADMVILEVATKQQELIKRLREDSRQ